MFDPITLPITLCMGVFIGFMLGVGFHSALHRCPTITPREPEPKEMSVEAVMARVQEILKEKGS